MASNSFDDRPGTDPLADSSVRIIIINCPSGRVYPIQRIPGSTICEFCYRLIKLAVCDSCKRAWLIDNAGKCIRRRGMLNPIENNSSYCYLAGIRLAPSFCRDNASQKIDVCLIGLRYSTDRNSQSFEGLRSGNPINCKPLLFLKFFYCFLGLCPINTVDIAVIEALFLECLLDRF